MENTSVKERPKIHVLRYLKQLSDSINEIMTLATRFQQQQGVLRPAAASESLRRLWSLPKNKSVLRILLFMVALLGAVVLVRIKDGAGLSLRNSDIIGNQTANSHGVFERDLSSSSRHSMTTSQAVDHRWRQRRLQQQQLHNYLSADDYVSPLEQYPIDNIDSYPLPPPLQAMHDYIRQHTRNVVLKELDMEPLNSTTTASTTLRRVYTIAYYSCPDSAGNWLHYFTTTLQWAMLMNRTIVYKYMDAAECHDIRSSMTWKFSAARCRPPATNTLDDCTPHILTRAPWMLSYDELAVRLGWITSQTLHRVPRLATTDYVERHYQNGNYRQQYALDNYSYYSQYPLIAMYPWLKRLTHLHDQPAARAVQLQHQSSRDYYDYQLAAWGLPFLNGMILRSCFDFAPRVKQVVQRTMLLQSAAKHVLPRQIDTNELLAADYNNDDDAAENSAFFSVVLHSRHIEASDGGCNIEREQACLEAVLQQQQQSSKQSGGGCSVTVLSDRVCTIRNLNVWLRHGRASSGSACRVIVADHGNGGQSASPSNASITPPTLYDASLSEHGPFSADGGFFVDVLLASLTARNGMVGEIEPREGNRWRTSSELVEDFVAYSRMMEYWQVSALLSGVDGTATRRRRNAATPLNAAPPLDDFIECTLHPSDRKQKLTELAEKATYLVKSSAQEELDGPIKVTVLPNVKHDSD